MAKTIDISKLNENVQERISIELEFCSWDAIFVKEKAIKYFDKDSLYEKDIENLNERGYLLVKGI